MAFTRKVDFTFKHVNQDDEPVYADPATLKTNLDSQAVEMREYINETFLPELESVDGAASVGVDSPHGETLQEVLDYIESTGTGTAPGNDTVTNAMMHPDVKIGSLSSLLTTIKTSIVSAINELAQKIVSLGAFTGVVWMYTGTIASIPTGWALCDGQNGTPDLRHRFVYGANDQTEMNTTGGSNTKTLTANELPSHSHTGTTNADGIHNHGFDLPRGSSSGSYGLRLNATESGNSSFTTANSTTHTHGFTTNATGSGNAFDIKPAYYALAFIMKL